MSTPHQEGTTMNPTAKKTIDALGTTGILTLIVAAITLGFVLWGEPDTALISSVLFAPLATLGALFTAAWLATSAIVEQLAHSES